MAGRICTFQKKGILQRIHQTDLNRNGYIDLVFCNSQNHEENVPVYIYPDPVHAPDFRKEIFIRGSWCGEAADINGDGITDLVIGCCWDGLTQHLNAAVIYGGSDGLTNAYLDFLPAAKSSSVAIGDFNGSGLMDIAFISQDKLKIFYQHSGGFPISKGTEINFPDAFQITAVKSGKYHHLLIRKKDGSCVMIKGSTDGIPLNPEPVCIAGPDPDYALIKKGDEGYTQSVAENPARIQVLYCAKGKNTAVTPYIFLARKKSVLLLPFTDVVTSDPIEFKCQSALAAAAGSIRGNGFTDLVFACRDVSTGTECSWIYYGDADGWKEENRFALPSYNACDVALADFSGNGYGDAVICQGNTEESYTSETLIFAGNAGGVHHEPVRIISHNAIRAIPIHNGKNKKPSLVILNRHSGSRIGNADANIYFGGPGGFSAQNRKDLPAWGATDMVSCDLFDSGFPDVVFANASELSPWLDPGSYIYKGSAAGFSNSPDILLATSRAHGVAAGDFNHSGFLDLAFGGFDNPVLKIFYGSEKGFLPENAVSLEMKYKGKIYKEPRFITCADLNNNGWLDLVVPIINENICFILWGGPEGFSFDNVQALNVRNGCNVKVADLNKDGWPELIVGGHTQSDSGPHDAFVYIYWGSPHGFSESRKTLLPANAVNSIAVADFNNDGWLDLFIASYQDGRQRDIDSFIYWNQGHGEFLPHKVTPLRTHAVSGNVAADFNEDGYIDLAVANHKVFGEHISYSTVWYNGPDGFNDKHTVNLPSQGIHGIGNVDPGNVLDRGHEEYYTSAPYGLSHAAGITSFGCTAAVPAKTWVHAQFRTAASEEALEHMPWRGPTGTASWFTPGQRVDKTLFHGKWMQYRLAIGAYNSLNTPRISEVIIHFE